MRAPLLILLLAVALGAKAQNDELLAGELRELPAMDAADAPTFTEAYDAFNATLGGDSVRMNGAQPCEGWVEDRWPDGRLKHRGYYQAGRLLLYKDHYTDGTLAREYKALDGARSQLRTWHANGALRSEALYVKGEAWKYEEHYPNGQLRYQEEKHRNEPCYVLMDLFTPDGAPVSTFHLVDKKRLVFDQKEYHPNGQLRVAGRAQFDPTVHDCKRIGTWTYYTADGKPAIEEVYVDGKVHERKQL